MLIRPVQPLSYPPNRYTINITVLTLESPSSSLLAWSKDHSIIFGLRYRLTGAPARWHCTERGILVPQATINNKCHSLYVALVSSIAVVIQIYSCVSLTWIWMWMDGDICVRRRYSYSSLCSYRTRSYQSENHHHSTNERSFKLRYRDSSVLPTRRSKVRAFSFGAIPANRHTAMITAAAVLMSTDQPNARASTPSNRRYKAAAEIKIQAHQAAVAVVVIVMIDAWCASSHRSESILASNLTRSAAGNGKHTFSRAYCRVVSNHLE